jgi:uncharacterized protein
MRMAMRRVFARRKRLLNKDVWPINESAGQPPAGWPGWPDKKQFAFILSHDVEGADGLAKCRKLAELEMKLGFRSSFNLIPEGSYTVPAELRHWLTDRGFEIGVHDLRHDGRLYESRAGFLKKAHRINHYLKEWGAVGFRSGFMLNRLEWLHHLDIQYDASTFDSDPFEPQPDGQRTIFPFVVKARDGRPDYVELPYTLVQDSTLYLLLAEKGPDIWLKKLDWIASRGGMALIIVHPDYLCFPGDRETAATFPVQFYSKFLETVQSRYSGKYWHALPREAAAYVHGQKDMERIPFGSRKPTRLTGKPKIWIDLENTPHIPFFKPIVRELKERGYPVIVTARDAYQTCEMADQYGLEHTKIGRHYGKNRFLKGWGLFARGSQLLPFTRREKPDLALNHGSRTQTLVCNTFGIPSVTIMDYEYTAELFFLRPRWEVVPSVVSVDAIPHQKRGGLCRYSGIKEDVYVPDFVPDPALLPLLGLKPDDLIVTVRPPASEAHYHNHESDLFFRLAMERFCAAPEVRVVLLPRNKRQEKEVRALWPKQIEERKIIIPDQVVDGLNLLWHSDFAVSGGGTMNREAAALGVPVYSIFRGRIGAVDRHLQTEGRLVLIETVEEVAEKILIQRRPRSSKIDLAPRKALGEIVNHIEEILRVHYSW